MSLNLPHLQSWIGRSESLTEALHPFPANALAATLDRADPTYANGTALPPVWHWLHFLPLSPLAEAGPDGHPARGGFLPPVPLPRRMWAGSRLSFLAPLRIGAEATKTSTVKSVTMKEGRSGPLVFVTVQHAVTANGATAIEEEHDIVYRENAPAGVAPPPPPAAPTGATFERLITPDPVLLFRYSALTFNSHRIHYDQPYVTAVEGYPGLIVHGPLIATLLLDNLRRAHPNRRVTGFTFKAVSPLFDVAPFTVLRKACAGWRKRASVGQPDRWRPRDGGNRHAGLIQVALGGARQMKLTRRLAALGLAASAAMAMAMPATTMPAMAQGFPTKPVTMLIPFAAGGPTDVVGRLIGEHMARTLGQPVIIENAVGAAGTLAGNRLIASPSDGHTILIGHTGTHAAAVSLNPNLRYKPVEDFAHVGLVNTNPIFINVRKTHPANTLKELVDWLKANQATANNAHAGVGSVSHTTCLLFHSVIGVSIKGIPYRGTAPAMNDLVGGQVDYLCDQGVNVAPQTRAGTIKTLAIAQDKRAALLPDVPTSAEAGVPDFKVIVWNAMFTHKDAPAAAQAALNKALRAALSDPVLKGKLDEIGAEVPSADLQTPAGLRSFIGSEINRWTPIIQASGVRLE